MTAIPTELRYHQDARELELVYADGCYRLSAEFLRVYSPSAEVRGHGVGQEVLQTGKRLVAITGIEPVGNYALKLVFSDGHNTGLYTWPYLGELCRQRDRLWADYLARLTAAGASREPVAPGVARFDPPRPN